MQDLKRLPQACKDRGVDTELFNTLYSRDAEESSYYRALGSSFDLLRLCSFDGSSILHNTATQTPARRNSLTVIGRGLRLLNEHFWRRPLLESRVS